MQFVIPAKHRGARREPGSRSFCVCSAYLDSGSRDKQHRLSGMTGFSSYDTVSEAGNQEKQPLMDSLLRGSDGLGDFLRDHQI